MQASDRYGRTIRREVFGAMQEYGISLIKIGFKESQNKPNLFYKKVDELVIFADMRGSENAPIWECAYPRIYWKEADETQSIPLWIERRIALNELIKFEEVGCPFRCSKIFGYLPEQYDEVYSLLQHEYDEDEYLNYKQKDEDCLDTDTEFQGVEECGEYNEDDTENDALGRNLMNSDVDEIECKYMGFTYNGATYSCTPRPNCHINCTWGFHCGVGVCIRCGEEFNNEGLFCTKCASLIVEEEEERRRKIELKEKEHRRAIEECRKADECKLIKICSDTCVICDKKVMNKRLYYQKSTFAENFAMIETAIIHHISYIQEITTPVCRRCHAKIHFTKGDPIYDAFKPIDRRVPSTGEYEV